MISSRNVDLNSLVTIDSNGLNVASFVDIKRVLIDKYKEIYGNDIDLSTGNADGEYVNELALMLNNILQSLSTLYGNLDVNTASGVYLDALCALSNVRRKQATPSRATIQLTNNYENSIPLQAGVDQFSDQSGMLWNIEESFTLEAGESKTIEVVCSTLGEVKAPSGWIDTLVGYPLVDVVQNNAATIGQSLESDTSLRARRNQFISPIGITVLQGLSASLLDIQGIKDVKIYNNQSDNATPQTTLTALDDTVVNPHGIYVVIRQYDNNTNIDDTIANTIYGKLTPGIQTTQSDVTADRKSKVYIPTILGLTVSSYTETIYWRLATPVHPTITLQYSEVANSGYDPNTPDLIGNAMFDYLNNLPIGVAPNINEVVMEMLMADPRQKGISTITVNYTNINLTNVSSNPDTYYNYGGYLDIPSTNQGITTHTMTLLEKDQLIINNISGNQDLLIYEKTDLTETLVQTVVHGGSVQVPFFFNSNKKYVLRYDSSNTNGLSFTLSGIYEGITFENKALTKTQDDNTVIIGNPSTDGSIWSITNSAVLTCVHN